MKNLIKDRKNLLLVFSLVLVSVFTLTIAYSALSAVLTINGNARVSAADWDIYLNNPRVTNGSATTNVPVIKTSSTLEFETTLNMPGDFYEVVVDVVNAGDIDAMIENVVKTPELTAEQAKFLKYEVSYQNGESITTKQLLAKDTTMPIKVRVEYRKDLSNGDLPTGQVVLDLALTLEYVQSDGTGSSVTNNGKLVPNIVNGDSKTVGSEVAIGNEHFYIISSNDISITMLAKYNLYVGNECTSSTSCTPYGEEATGIQDSKMVGEPSDYSYPSKGVTSFSSRNYWANGPLLRSEYGTGYPAYIYDNNSILYNYAENYKDYLESLGTTINEARLITIDELEDLGCDSSNRSCSGAPNWVYSTSYWSSTAHESYGVRCVRSDGGLSTTNYSVDYACGVRLVIIISKDYFN